MFRRSLIALLVAALPVSGCSGSSSTGSTTPHSAGSSSAVPLSQTLPPAGTARLPDGRTYTVAPPGRTLRLDDLALTIDGLTWDRHARVPVVPPGTKTFAVARVTLHNTGTGPGRVTPTQIWLLAGSKPYLAAGGTLIGDRVPAGGSVTGLLVFPMPGRASGGLLVYRFADAAAISNAKRVGVARYDA